MLLLHEEERTKYILAGEIARKIKREAYQWVKAGESLLYLCEKIEKRVLELGGLPAFPCNIGVNEVAAHFTPPPYFEEKIPLDGLVKIDFGVHVDGYIVDTALTISLSPKYNEMVEVANESLRKVSKVLKEGVKTSQIGEAIESFVRSKGYKIIRNLTGHQIDRFNLHTGFSIPNFKTLGGEKFSKNTVVAIEPFITSIDGAGEVGETNYIYIYRFKNMSTDLKGELSNLNKMMQSIFKTLPFCERWFLDRFGESERENLVKLLNYAKKQFVFYPVLVEKNRMKVAQAEDTFLILEDSVINLTGED